MPGHVLVAMTGLLAVLGSVSAIRSTGSAAPGAADVSRVYKSWDEWRAAYDELVAALDAFDALAGAPIDGAGGLLAVLEARDRVYSAARGPEGFLYLLLELDSGDEEALVRQGLMDEVDRRWYGSGQPWLESALTEVGWARAEEWMESHRGLRLYRYFLRRFFDSADHLLPADQPELRALSTVAARQSSRLYRALALSEAPAVEVLLESGEPLALDPARAYTILGELASRRDRHAASRAWLEALGGRSQAYAALLEGIVGQRKVLAEARGFDSALSAQLANEAIPAATMRAAIGAAVAAPAPVRRYHALRRRALALDDYGMADRFVPLAVDRRKIAFDEARRLVVASSATLGPEVREIVERAFGEGWIDAVERPGKRAHGGSTFIAGHPFVLVSYRGSLRNLFQLVHEMGHAVHALLAHQSQPFVYGHRSSLTSEAVAGVFEGVLVAHMISATASAEHRVEVLELSIQNLLRNFYQPMLAADFELRLYETERPIDPRSLRQLHLELAGAFYGDTVTLHEWDAHGWQQTPHYFTSPLYLGRYGLAAAAAHALVPRLTSTDRTEAAAARRDVLALMEAGASDDPLALLRRAGVDLHDPGAVSALATRMDDLVRQLEQALEGE